MIGRWTVAGMLAVLVGSAAIEAQLPRPLTPVPEQGNRVAPFFDGWYANPDGTISLSFGFSNLNKEPVEIPLGPNNFIEPKQYDGRQPTAFVVVPITPPGGRGGRGGGAAAPGTGTGAGAGPGAANPSSTAATTDPAAGSPPAGGGAAGAGGGGAGGGGAGGGGAGGGGAGGGGGGGDRYPRERGVFTVTVPADFRGDVVWTLRHQGQSWSVPGRSKSGSYQLSWPMAMGSTPPLLRFQPNGPSGRGPVGIQGPQLQAKVGVPLELTIWLTDDAIHDKEPIPIKRDVVPSMNVTWFKHAGSPGPVKFRAANEPVNDPQGKATTTATFEQPGEYVLRVRGDTWGNTDSSAGDQCCWTNGYWKVVVTR